MPIIASNLIPLRARVKFNKSRFGNLGTVVTYDEKCDTTNRRPIRIAKGNKRKVDRAVTNNARLDNLHHRQRRDMSRQRVGSTEDCRKYLEQDIVINDEYLRRRRNKKDTYT